MKVLYSIREELFNSNYEQIMNSYLCILLHY